MLCRRLSTWNLAACCAATAARPSQLSFAIVRVEVRGSSCVRVELGNSSKIPRVSIIDNGEEMFFAIPRQCRENVFRSNQPVCRPCNRPVEVVHQNTLIPVWFGHFWLATIWTTCLNQFLDNFEKNVFRNSSTMLPR